MNGFDRGREMPVRAYRRFAARVDPLRATAAALLFLCCLAGDAHRASAQEREQEQEQGSIGAFWNPTTLRILADQPVKQVQFAVSPRDGVDPARVAVGLEDVTLDGLQDAAINELFAAAWDPRVPAVRVTIQMRPALRPGSYQMRLRLRARVKDRALEQVQVVTIAVPAATIRSLGTLVVRQTKWFWGQPEITGAALRVQETSKLSRVSELAVVPLAVTSDAGPVDNDARLAFDAVLPEIGPGTVGELRARLNGTFPLGSAKGTLQITASQLAQPYEASYEVVTAWTDLALLGVIALGIWVGYLVKTKITLQTKVNEAVLQATTVLRHLDPPMYPDATFEKAIAESRDALKAALNDQDPQTIADKSTKAQEALTAALEDLRKRKADRQVTLTAVLQLVGKRWSLPARMEDVLARTQGVLRSVQTTLEKGDANKAEGEIEQARVDAMTGLLTNLKQWRQGALDGLNRVPASRQPLLAVLDDARVRELGELEASLTAMPTPEMESDLEPLLQGVTDVRKRMYRCLESIVLDLVDMAAGVTEIIGRHGGDVGLVNKMVGDLKQPLGSWKPEVLIETLNSQAAALHDALSDLVLAAAPVVDRNEVEALLNEGRYRAAAKRVSAPLIKVAGIGISEASVQLPIVEPSWSRMFATRRPSLPAEYPAGETTVILQETSTIASPPTVAAIRGQARAALLSAKRWNTAIAACIAVAAGYVIFEESFVGTAENFAAAFVWALGVDASVEVVLESVKSKLGKSDG